MEIFSKLSAIQAAINVPKKHRNEYGNYPYRKAEDILEAVKPHLQEQGCTLTVVDELVYLEGRFYIKATATITSSGDGSCVSTSAFAREQESRAGMDASQVTGSSSSYARKYALGGLFCVDDSLDADVTNKTKAAQANNKDKEQTASTKKLSDLQEEIYAKWVEAVASNKKTKDTGIPVMDELISQFQPSAAELALFNKKVQAYRKWLKEGRN